MQEVSYSTQLQGAGHWSLRMRRGTCMRLTNTDGHANVGMLFYNPENLLERYNAPDTLKCQHTFKLTRGNCLYSDMGRIFASIIEDTHGWHDTVTGSSSAALVSQRWGNRDYQTDRNNWKQNGFDAFLVELVKYGLDRKDLAANINWFSKVIADNNGNLTLDTEAGQSGQVVTLRFEMDTLVILHTCPHPLNTATDYPRHGVAIDIGPAAPVSEDDYCRNFRPENSRGFANNALYHTGFNR